VSLSQGIALAVASVCIGWLFWKYVITPWHPLEGLEKLLFGIGCWWGGGWMTYYGITRHLYYWGVSLLIGLVLLAWGGGLTYGLYHRWRKDQVIFGTKATPLPVPRSRQEDKAA